ncbi:hypothetical protein FHR87_002662 [Azomonas macrocytogenes]|uniref:Uncharacterized protein n=1 Tax=Azomonas macrocytogenes TaxID=69962 RepID=A0A839T3Y1_AZOMA|nr:hypothetical protein [Azomonas macrocytogenes]
MVDSTRAMRKSSIDLYALVACLTGVCCDEILVGIGRQGRLALEFTLRSELVLSINRIIANAQGYRCGSPHFMRLHL